MCITIGIEDLAANALIERINRGKVAFVSYADLECYGAKVVDILKSQGKVARCLLSGADTREMYLGYSHIFEEKEVNTVKGVALKDGVTVSDLIEKFRGYLAWDVLLALVDTQALKSLNLVE